jgi:hypothetical protein
MKGGSMKRRVFGKLLIKKVDKKYARAVTHLQNSLKRGSTARKAAFLLGFLHDTYRFGSREGWAFIGYVIEEKLVILFARR